MRPARYGTFPQTLMSPPCPTPQKQRIILQPPLLLTCALKRETPPFILPRTLTRNYTDCCASRRACCHHRTAGSFEEKSDVKSIDHAFVVVGDVSEHKMCNSCRIAWGKNICPFCKEMTTANELIGFIQELVRGINHNCHDPNASAALLERVEIFEMELESQPQVIKRVYRMVIEEASFSELLDGALAETSDWPRDCAGILLRLDAAAEAGELAGLAPRARDRLANVVENLLWKPFDQTTPENLDPHFFGALYTQACVAWLCALRTGMSTERLAENVRRAGRSLCRWKATCGRPQHDIRRATERMHPEYMMLTSEPIYGSQKKDIVYQAFFK